MNRKTEYCEWSIDAGPIMYGKQYRAGAVIELGPTEGAALGQRFVFSKLGDQPDKNRLGCNDAGLRNGQARHTPQAASRARW
jgi:hypothetical protein